MVEPPEEGVDLTASVEDERVVVFLSSVFVSFTTVRACVVPAVVVTGFGLALSCSKTPVVVSTGFVGTDALPVDELPYGTDPVSTTAPPVVVVFELPRTAVPPIGAELIGFNTLSFDILRGLSEPGMRPYFTGLPPRVFPPSGCPFHPPYPQPLP